LETTGHTGGPVPGGRPAPGQRGLIDGLLSLFASFGQYFEAIGALAGEEAREAGELSALSRPARGGGFFCGIWIRPSPVFFRISDRDSFSCVLDVDPARFHGHSFSGSRGLRGPGEDPLADAGFPRDQERDFP